MRLGNFPVELRVAVLGVGPAAPQLRQLDQLGCAGGDVISVSVVVNRRQGDALDDGRGVDAIPPHFDQVLVERRSNVVDGPALLGPLKVAAQRAAAAPRVGNASTPNATHCSNGAFDDVVGSAGVEAQVHLKGRAHEGHNHFEFGCLPRGSHAHVRMGGWAWARRKHDYDEAKPANTILLDKYHISFIYKSISYRLIYTSIQANNQSSSYNKSYHSHC